MNCRFKAVAASFKESQFLFARLAVQNAHTHTAAVRCSLHTEFLRSASPSAALSGIITSLPHFDTCHSQLGIRSSLWARSRWHPRRQQLPLPVSLLPPPPPPTHLCPYHPAAHRLFPGLIQACRSLEEEDEEEEEGGGGTWVSDGSCRHKKKGNAERRNRGRLVFPECWSFSRY